MNPWRPLLGGHSVETKHWPLQPRNQAGISDSPPQFLALGNRKVTPELRGSSTHAGRDRRQEI